MKTDRFSDAIRRKLESIRPEFTDKDWTRMQASLHQAGFPQPDPGVTSHPFSGGVWHSHPWLLAAASVSTVALIAVGVWQRSEINDLRQTVSQLKQKATTTQVLPLSPITDHPVLTKSAGSSSVPQTQSSTNASDPSLKPTLSEQQTASLPHDTAYLNQYTHTLTASGSNRSPERTGQPLTKLADKESVLTRRTSSSTLKATHPQTELTLAPKTDTYDISSTPSLTEKSVVPKANLSVAENRFVRRSLRSNRLREKTSREQRYVDTYSPPSTSLSNRAEKPSGQVDPQLAPTSETNNDVSATYELIAGRPLSTKSLNWNALVASQVDKRMRPSHPATPVVAQAQTPTTQLESQVARTAVHFRAGIGTEVASQLWGNGIFTEAVIGRHWLVGVGLNQTVYKAAFANEHDFKESTHLEFRYEFIPRNDPDPRRAIFNISERTTRLQVPIYLGYRIPVSNAIALLPSVGTYLNLKNTENATFYSVIVGSGPVPGLVSVSTEKGVGNSINRPVDLINNLALTTGVEWQHKHWVAQASPVLTIPFQAANKPASPELSWQQSVTLGLRARVLYQF